MKLGSLQFRGTEITQVTRAVEQHSFAREQIVSPAAVASAAPPRGNEVVVVEKTAAPLVTVVPVAAVTGSVPLRFVVEVPAAVILLGLDERVPLGGHQLLRGSGGSGVGGALDLDGSNSGDSSEESHLVCNYNLDRCAAFINQKTVQFVVNRFI